MVLPAAGVGSLVSVVATSRAGAFSSGVYAGFNLAQHVGDDAEQVSANRKALLHHYEPTGLRQIQWLEQVHGIDVVTADSVSACSVPTADAAWTDQPGLGLAVLTADCLPVVLAACDGSSIGIAHGGWRGLVRGVLVNLFEQMEQRKPAANGYRAWIGPAISVAAYEVGEDVAAEVRACGAAAVLHPGQVPGKYQLDLPALAQRQLQELGIREVMQSGICSVSNPACYSYRRDGVTGRMATLVWLHASTPPEPAGCCASG